MKRNGELINKGINIESHTYCVAIIFIIFGVFLICSCSKKDVNNRVLRIGYSPYSVNVPLFIAVEEGLFTKENIRVELFPFQSTDLLGTSLTNNSLDVATALTAEGVYSLNGKYHDAIRPFFFNLYAAESSIDAIVIPRDSTLKSLKDLKNHRVGILPADMMKAALQAALIKSGIEPSTVEVLAFPPASVLSALASGKLDACYILEPLVTISRLQLKAKILAQGIGAKSITNPLPAGFHCINSMLIKDDRNLGPTLSRIYSRGAEMAMDRNLSEKVLIKYCALTPEVAHEVELPRWSTYSTMLQLNLREQFNALKIMLGWDNSLFEKTIYVLPN